MFLTQQTPLYATRIYFCACEYKVMLIKCGVRLTKVTVIEVVMEIVKVNE
jgi:hypothetical protein